MINNIGEKGIVTLPSLLMMNKPETNLEHVIKRYAIFFDELYYFDNPLEGVMSFDVETVSYAKNQLQKILIRQGGDDNFILSRQFNEIIRDDEDVIEYFKANRTDYRRDSFMEKEHKIAFQNHVKNALGQEEQNSPNLQFILGAYMHYLFVDFDLYSNLSKEDSEFSGLLSPLLRGVIYNVFNSYKHTGEEIIGEVAKIEFIDFGQLNWFDIYDLRKSGFTKSFRLKIRDWLIEYEDERDINLLNSKIDKYIRDSKFKFLQKNRANIPLAIFTAIFGNIPFTIPNTSINPVSLLSGVNDVRKNINNKNKFGWLHFIEQIYTKSQK